MSKNIIFAILTIAFCFNVAQVACPLSAQEVKAVQATTPTNQTAVNAKTNEVDRATLRVENQIKRLAKDLTLTEKQIEDARKLYIDCDKQQTELRAKIAELNKEKQTKFESLLTDEQKQKMATTKNSSNILRDRNKARMDRLKSATPIPQQQGKPLEQVQEKK